MAADNAASWPLMRPRLADPRLKPSAADVHERLQFDAARGGGSRCDPLTGRFAVPARTAFVFVVE